MGTDPSTDDPKATDPGWVDDVLFAGRSTDVCLRLPEPVDRATLHRLVTAAQERLSAAGLRPGGAAALRMPPSLAYVVNLLATWRTGAQAIQASFFFVLPNIMLSGFMFPREGMPPFAQWLGLAVPLTYFLQILRGVILKGVGFDALWPQSLALVGFAILFFAFSVQRFHKTLD